MKAIPLFLFLLSLKASSQTRDPNPHFPVKKISTTCNQDFLDNYKGNWLIHRDLVVNSPNSNFTQETLKRNRLINQLLLQIYPQPMGSDGIWQTGYLKTYFANKTRYIDNNGSPQLEYVTSNPVEGWGYSLILFPWSCDNMVKGQIKNGYPEESGGNFVDIVANHPSIADAIIYEDDIMSIDGRAIHYRKYIIGSWKGYPVFSDVMPSLASETSGREIMITRAGASPYIPVTRKQYLDRVMALINKMYDGYLANAKNMQGEEAVNFRKNTQEDKDNALKKYREALDESTRKGLLNSPALVLNGIMMENYGPIFGTEEQGARMLVTEDPNYFKKNLPGYIPQVFVLKWGWGQQAWCGAFRKAVEDNFPVEQLKGMIDK